MKRSISRPTRLVSASALGLFGSGVFAVASCATIEPATQSAAVAGVDAAGQRRRSRRAGRRWMRCLRPEMHGDQL